MLLHVYELFKITDAISWPSNLIWTKNGGLKGVRSTLSPQKAVEHYNNPAAVLFYK